MRLIGLVLALSLALAPLAAAQQKGKVYRIGLLSIATVTYIDAFRQGLRDLGYVEGRTIVIEYREAQSYERLPELAKELVGLKPDIIVSAGGSLVARAVQAVTSTIPVVFLASDVVAGGLVASLSRPDGNLTGLEISTTQLDAKRLEILKEALPTITTVALLWNPGSAAYNASNLADQRRGMQAAARRLACGWECLKHGICARSTPYLERSSARTPALCSWVATLYSRAGGNESLNWRRSCAFRRCTDGGSSWKWVVSCLMERAFPICIGVPPPMWTRSSKAPSPLTFPSSSQPSSNW